MTNLVKLDAAQIHLPNGWLLGEEDPRFGPDPAPEPDPQWPGAFAFAPPVAALAIAAPAEFLHVDDAEGLMQAIQQLRDAADEWEATPFAQMMRDAQRRQGPGDDQGPPPPGMP